MNTKHIELTDKIIKSSKNLKQILSTTSISDQIRLDYERKLTQVWNIISNIESDFDLNEEKVNSATTIKTKKVKKLKK
jgi:hypothetical protein